MPFFHIIRESLFIVYLETHNKESNICCKMYDTSVGYFLFVPNILILNAKSLTPKFITG